MKERDIIKAIAELDGWKLESYGPAGYGNLYWRVVAPDGVIKKADMCGEAWVKEVSICFYPPYLTSRDAIIPVIEKQPVKTQAAVGDELFKLRTMPMKFCPTASEFCEALLRATGKWAE